MSAQIQFFKKNIIDLDNTAVTITATDGVASSAGDSITDYLRNRKNTSSWITTDSTDAGNTTLTVNWTADRVIDHIILVKHNFKAYTIKYWNGSTYVAFPTAIAPSSDTNETTEYNTASTTTSRIQIIVTGTQTPDDDKKMAQLIVTEELGQFSGWPVVSSPMLSKNRQITTMLSGKKNIVDSVGFFSCTLTVDNWKDDTDLTLVETIYDRSEGVLLWLCGGDESQFSSVRKGWRKEDLFLVRPSDELTNEFVKGLYVTGIKVKIKLEEVIR
jgi:hypothetical protein